MDRRALLIAALLVAGGCARITGTQGVKGGPCGPQVRGSGLVTARWAMTLVGETHGTVETPAAFARLVCRAAERAHPSEVLVGLELPRGNQAAIDAALAEPDDAQARAELLGAPHWDGSTRDGRASEAMLDLLLELRRQRRAGLAIAVVAFDVDPATMTATTDRDAAMAQHFEAAIAAHPDATVLALVGSWHTRRRGMPDEREPPMAARLLAEHPELQSITTRAAPGSAAWACEGDDLATLDCRTHALAAGEDRGDVAFVELRPPDDARTYDGVLYVGRTTASPPAVRR